MLTPKFLMSKPKYWDVRRAIKDTVRTYSQEDLVNAFNRSPLKNLGLWPLDTRYRAVPVHVWQQILAYNGVDKEKYQSEFFDCDNFAQCLIGDVAQRWKINGIGLVMDFSAGHAYNAVLCDDEGRLYISVVEPQTDCLFEDKTPYEARMGVVTFS